MNRFSIILSLLVCMSILPKAYSQTNTYSTSGGEVIFSWGDMQYTQAYQEAYPEAGILKNPIRFTAFFHIQQFWHIDFNNSIGIFTGVGLRNIGIISDEVLPNEISDAYNTNNPYTGDYFNAKVIRRTYSLGIPLALKIGSFKDHMHVYAGGEIEWSFHMKEKWWNNHSRSGTKTKTTSWWPSQITTFQPSAFVGIQFPRGINLKFKYYLENFLNHDYQVSSNTTNTAHIVSDLTKYEKSNLFYVAIAFHFKTSKLYKKEPSSGSVASIY